MKEIENVKMWPVYYDNKWWNECDCGSIFISLYHERYLLREDGCVYIGDGSWVFPDDTFEHDDNR